MPVPNKKIRLKMKHLRRFVRESVRHELSSPYEQADENNLMLDQPGMEEKYRNKIRDYLRKLGMIK
tara:strand:+ start:3333 stop:3530 length:198 start_codon:yes stop_codon:yes gene_type:complete